MSAGVGAGTDGDMVGEVGMSEGRALVGVLDGRGVGDKVVASTVGSAVGLRGWEVCVWVVSEIR